MNKLNPLTGAIAAAVLALSACSQGPLLKAGSAATPVSKLSLGDQRQAVLDALENYRALAARMDHQKIAQLCTVDAVMSHGKEAPTVGRNNILRFLKSFEGYQVQAYEMSAAETTVSGAAATQTGRWKQTVKLPAGNTITVQGDFSAEWQLTDREQWQLKRLHTST